MSMYENLVMQTQMNYSRYYGRYAAGKTPVRLSDRKPLPYEKQIEKLNEKIKEADCIVVGGASGLSSAGSGDFYYEDTPSFRRYFGKFAEKYGFQGAFAGMGYPYKTRGEFWAYLATFLHTTQTAPVREPYLDLDAILQGKDFFILTTNQDTQFVKIYPEEKVAQIQGDHRFFKDTLPHNRAFREMLRPAKEQVKHLSPDNIAQRSGAVFHERDGVLELQSLNQTVRIAVPEYTFSPRLEEWHQLVILHYLALADGTAVSTQVITFGGLKDGLIRGTKFDHDMEKELQRFLNGKTPDCIRKICKALGAEFADSNADLCAVFHFLPNYPVWLKIWFADEEFEAFGKLYLSRSADHYLSMEDAVTVGEVLLSKLKIQEQEHFKDASSF